MTRVSAIFGFFCNSNPNFRSRPVWSEKKLTNNNYHSTKYFRSPFRLIWFDDANVPIFLSDQTQLAYCLFVIHILQILATRQNCQPARYVYQQDLELFHAMPSLTKESFSQNIWWPSSSVLNANFCLLKTTIITGNLTSLTCHWLFYYSKEKEKMPALGHMNNFFFSFVLDF